MPENKKNPKAIDTTYGHLQPQALDAERVVLGALMIDKDAFTVVSDVLCPEAFYEPRNQKIYHAIQTLSMDEKPVDIITVTDELAKEGTLEDVGGPGYVLELSSKVASSANIVYHSRIIVQKYLVDELMQEAEGSLFELSQSNLKQDYTSLEPVVKEALDKLKQAAANSGGLTGIPTGYVKLDDITSGWQASDLVIIAGRPAMGKTSFALSLAKNIVIDYQIPAAFFSLEMSNVQLVDRLLSNVCEISGKKILNGQLDDEEWKRIDKNVRRMQTAPLYIDDTPGMSIFELRTKARRLVREKGVKIIMIDYLQLMNANGARFGSRQEEVSTISRSLKGLAKELGIPVLALSQLNRSVENRDGNDGKRPQLSDLRESGAIEQDADMVLFVHRPEYYHIYTDDHGRDLRGMAQIIIAKHRKGATGDVLLNFRGEFTRFENPDDNRMQQDFGGEVRGSVINSKINGGDMPPVDQDAPFGTPPDFDIPSPVF